MDKRLLEGYSRIHGLGNVDKDGEGKISPFLTRLLNAKDKQSDVKYPIIIKSTSSDKLTKTRFVDGFITSTLLEHDKTDLTKFIEQQESSFSYKDGDTAILIIDPDVVRKKSLEQGLGLKEAAMMEIENKVEKLGEKNKNLEGIELSNQVVSDLAHNLVSSDFPDNYTLDKDGKKLSVIVTGNPDVSLDDKLSEMFEEKVRVNKDLGITREQFTEAVIYHEIAHGLDKECGREPKKGEQELDVRHREEAVADVFAVFNMSARYGNTDFAKAFADIRAIAFNTGVRDAGNLKNSEFSMAYCTAPIMDKAIKHISENKQELVLVSNKAMIKKAVAFVEQNKFSAKELEEKATSVLQGDKNSDVVKRAEIARSRLITKKRKTQVAQGAYSPENVWLIDFYQRISDHGSEDISEVINDLRDGLRKEKFSDVKDLGNTLNEAEKRPVFAVGDANLYNDFSRKLKDLCKEEPKEKGIDALNAFMKIQGKSYADCEKSFDAFISKDTDKAEKSFNDAIKNEARLFGLAREVKKDGELWSKVSKDVNLKATIEAKSINRPPLWTMAYAASIENKYWEASPPTKLLKANKAIFAKSVVGLQKILGKDFIAPKIEEVSKLDVKLFASNKRFR